MSTPPPEYYADLAIKIGPVAVTLSIMTGVLFLIFAPKLKLSAGAVSIFVSPLLYLLGFWYLVTNGEYKDKLHEILNYDRSSAVTRHQEFYFTGMEVLFVALAAYGLFCLFVFLVQKAMNKGHFGAPLK